MTLTLRSSAFDEGEAIPEEHACDGSDTSPPLAWEGAPDGTESFVLIMDDPDAPMGTWVHWVLYDLPAGTRSLGEDVPARTILEAGGTHGENSWGKIGYGGPCPPSGTHRYVFKLYALNGPLGLDPGADKREVERAMEGRILEEARLTGTYTAREE